MKIKSTSFIIAIIFSLGIFPTSLKAQKRQVVLQAFWWDYSNSNYTNGWFNYLTELAPRLKKMGIEAVWIPPAVKSGGTNSVGYDPFDHYDLGDKYQKGLKTRLGDKNEFLRMVAVMHANGIDVIFDAVLNHAQNAESEDPAAKDNKWKNFRYTSYKTNATTPYLAREGRWPKNWQNFHSNTAHDCNTGDICSDWFGPDICYWDGAYGKSSNATFNPAQSEKYMRVNAREWLIWLKKQTGVDGFRFDAVKHFETWAMEDFLWNLQNGAGWANGGEDMFAVGEFVDFNGDVLNKYCTDVQDRAGTFDFSLRDGVKSMISGGGLYNLAKLPGTQQTNRKRTVSFLNSHDTFRPTLDGAGKYTGWNTGSELAEHIDPYDGRLAAGYAFAMAVDASPMIFFEDLFDLGTGKRYSHKPMNETDLPARSDIETLIHLSKQLDFKGGAYKIPYTSEDHLIIERSGKAIIGINDNWSTKQDNLITTDFPAGTILIDYSGSFSDKRTVQPNKTVSISTPPCNGTMKRKGYSVWAPEGKADFVNPVKPTVQEWEMADDLGDSHALSLKQGGQLPEKSKAYRTAGKIFVEANIPVKINLHPADATQDITLTITTPTCADSVSGKGDLVKTITPLKAGYLTIKARNTADTNKAQKVWIKATYTAPQIIVTSGSASLAADFCSGSSTGILENHLNNSILVYPNPSNGVFNVSFENTPYKFDIEVQNILGSMVYTETIDSNNESFKEFNLKNFPKGAYFLKINTPSGSVVKKIILGN